MIILLYSECNYPINQCNQNSQCTQYTGNRKISNDNLEMQKIKCPLILEYHNYYSSLPDSNFAWSATSSSYSTNNVVQT